jgi:hypothetical protein
VEDFNILLSDSLIYGSRSCLEHFLSFLLLELLDEVMLDFLV